MSDYVIYAFKESGFKSVQYTGNGDAERVFPAGVGFEPDAVWIKKRNNNRNDWNDTMPSSGSWNVSHNNKSQEAEAIENHRDEVVEHLKKKYPEDFI